MMDVSLMADDVARPVNDDDCPSVTLIVISGTVKPIPESESLIIRSPKSKRNLKIC